MTGTLTGVLVLDLWTLETTGVTSNDCAGMAGGELDLKRLRDEVLLLERVLLGNLEKPPEAEGLLDWDWE